MANIWNNAIFDYLNNNRHKFDNNGNFEPAPDPRDFWPLIFGSKYGKTRKQKGPKYAGRYPPHQGPDDVAKERMLYEAKDFANGIRYDAEKCDNNWDFEQALCRDGKYAPGCWERARDRYTKCRQLGHYDGLPIWTYQDETGQPQGADDPDRSAGKKTEANTSPGANPKPEDNPDQSKRATAGSLTETLLRMNPLLSAYLAANPEAAQVLLGGLAHLRDLPRELVLTESDYQRAKDYSPSPYLLPLIGAMMGPLGGPATMGARLPVLAPR